MEPSGCPSYYPPIHLCPVPVFWFGDLTVFTLSKSPFNKWHHWQWRDTSSRVHETVGSAWRREVAAANTELGLRTEDWGQEEAESHGAQRRRAAWGSMPGPPYFHTPEQISADNSSYGSIRRVQSNLISRHWRMMEYCQLLLAENSLYANENESLI